MIFVAKHTDAEVLFASHKADEDDMQFDFLYARQRMCKHRKQGYTDRHGRLCKEVLSVILCSLSYINRKSSRGDVFTVAMWILQSSSIIGNKLEKLMFTKEYH
jgi:hypothetical protein